MYIDYHYPFPVLALPYSLDSINCFIEKSNLCIHYQKIYQKYVENLNLIIAKYPYLKSWNIEELIFYQNELPKIDRNDIVKNAGGVYNHQIYFSSISPVKTLPSPALQAAINQSFTNIDVFLQSFYKACNEFSGFGFVFVCTDGYGKIIIVPTSLYDTTITLNLYPLIGIDLFEHAYYPKYVNNKKEYISNFIKFINWNYASDEFEKCLTNAKKG